jgi:glycosyltransferase involved in cell wall biosynthesis
LKVTVITAAYNSGSTIGETLESVANQTFKNIEHIVVDGLSKDDTLNIVAKYPDVKLVSEKDSGLYDAMNKGIKLASGDIVAILNSDDLFYNDNVVADIVKVFESSNASAVLSNIQIFEGDKSHVKRKYSAMKWQPWMFRIGWQPPHPGFFVLKSVYETIGHFNLKYSISADFDFMFRAIYKSKIPFIKVDLTTVSMRAGGLSQSGIKSIAKANMEDHQSIKSHGYFSFLPAIWSKYLFKIFQYL